MTWGRGSFSSGRRIDPEITANLFTILTNIDKKPKPYVEFTRPRIETQHDLKQIDSDITVQVKKENHIKQKWE